jgi:putative transposase
MSVNRRSEHWRTAIVPVRLTGTTYRAAHTAAHAAAEIWNNAVEWVHATWADGLDPDVWAIKKYLLTLTPHERPLHTHTTQEIAFDLADAIATFRVNRRNGLPAKAPHHHKNYRPLSFTRGYGWQVTDDHRLRLSLGRGRAPILVPIPLVTDPATGVPVLPGAWGEIRLCWDIDARSWTLHIAVPTTAPPPLDPDKIVAIDEGIINPLTLAAYAPDSTTAAPVIDVTVINGREARAIKRRRNKTIGALARQQSRSVNGSRRHKRLARARKAVNASAKAELRDFNHQVTRKAATYIAAHDTGRIIVGDVRGIEQRTRARQRANRSTRQQLSQWERGTHETLLAHKTGAPVIHIDESYSTQTCPACLTRNRPNGRNYRCRCGFTCHRDVVGAINILMRAIHGDYTPLDPDTRIRVTYLRAVPRWSPNQRATHSTVQRRHTHPDVNARARSRATNQAVTTDVAGEPNTAATDRKDTAA